MVRKRSNSVGESDGVKNCVNRTRGQRAGRWSLGQAGHGQRESPSSGGGVGADSPEENQHQCGQQQGPCPAGQVTAGM